MILNLIYFKITTILEINRIKPIIEEYIKAKRYEDLVKYLKIFNELKIQCD